VASSPPPRSTKRGLEMLPGPWLEKLLDILLAPGLWLSVLLALIYSLLFSAWRWNGWRQVGRDLLAGLVGFAVGQLIGTLLHLNWLQIGQVQLFWGTLAAVVFLAAGRWLRRPAKSR
jgi:uncharacterized membrane protein YeaQ/YmgE (transglycosylase-associated protein family)